MCGDHLIDQNVNLTNYMNKKCDKCFVYKCIKRKKLKTTNTCELENRSDVFFGSNASIGLMHQLGMPS